MDPLLIGIVGLCGVFTCVITCLGLKLRLGRGNGILTKDEYYDFVFGSSNTTNFEYHSEILSQPFNDKFRIPKNCLTFNPDDVIGSGHYGLVLRGTLAATAPQTKTATEVAIKTMKESVSGGNGDVEVGGGAGGAGGAVTGAAGGVRTSVCALLAAESNNKDKSMYFKALILDLKIMTHLGGHINVVNIFGAVIDNVKQGKIHIAFEFCTNRNLQGYLRKQKEELSRKGSTPSSDSDSNSKLPIQLAVNLLEWSRDIANGMAFINSKNVIHGNLSTRKVLLTQEKTAKICDFGLTRQLLNDYSNTTCISLLKNKTSWKWLALESLTSSTFSPQSDVWAFGVTLWEIFSLGDAPYPDLNYDSTFIDKISTGTRPLQPEYATDEIFSIMSKCWESNPTHRPGIVPVYTKFQEIIQNVKLIEGGSPAGPPANYIVLESSTPSTNTANKA